MRLFIFFSLQSVSHSDRRMSMLLKRLRIGKISVFFSVSLSLSLCVSFFYLSLSLSRRGKGGGKELWGLFACVFLAAPTEHCIPQTGITQCFYRQRSIPALWGTPWIDCIYVFGMRTFLLGTYGSSLYYHYHYYYYY